VYAASTEEAVSAELDQDVSSRQLWLVFAASIFLVAVPVFFQAPLVRYLPWVSLAMTPVLCLGATQLAKRPGAEVWGDLMLGFAWTWLSGSIYWGWLRWEPFFHLPVEAIALPFAVWGIVRGWGRVGNFFYLGSLFGTAITDLYFYIVDLIPHWRMLMRVENGLVQSIFQSAIIQVETPWGVSWALILATLLFTTSIVPLRSRQLCWWAFSGAVISTILVDGLFWIAASTA